MSITTLSSRDFNQKTSMAKKAARSGPVIITERGRPAHVLLTYEAYETLRKRDDRDILELLACPEVDEIEFEIPKIDVTSREFDLS